ncbi:MAG: MATE family efflux transporter [Myxococcales bacterium]|nr:MATE family efflux transporter [Myxococcales bacterium]
MDQKQSTISGQLFRLALPVIGLNVLAVLSIVVDTAMCGRLENNELVLSALGYATQLIFLLMVGMFGISVGTVAMVARAYGAGDSNRVQQVLGQSISLTFLVSAVIAVVGNIFAGHAMTALGASPETRDLGLQYLRPLLTGVVFTYLNVLFTAVLRGVGNTKLPFLVALTYNLINFVINYCLILGNFGFPKLGIQGAAIGTLVSYACGASMMYVILRRGTVPHVIPPIRPPALDRSIIRSLLSIGWPAALDMIILNAAFLSIVGMLGRIDEVAVAAHAIGLRIQGLAFVPGMSISQATAALVGQSLGAGDIERAKKVLAASLRMCSAVMSVLAIILVTFADPIVSAFQVAPGTSLHFYAVMWIQVLGYCMPLVGMYVAFVGLLQGAGATRVSLSINACVTLLVQIPLSYILGFPVGWMTFGVWVAFPLGFVLKGALGMVAYKSNVWAKTGTTVRR